MFAISYRREDSAPITGRIYDRLQARFGQEGVFIDLENIPPGIDFRSYISEALDQCAALLVVIGPQWLGSNPKGLRRIDHPTDFVRMEVAHALKRDIPIIPILIDATALPLSEDLPDDLKELAFRNALRVDSTVDFHHHVDRLCTALERIRPQLPPQLPIAAAGIPPALRAGSASNLMHAPVATAGGLPTLPKSKRFNTRTLFLLVGVGFIMFCVIVSIVGNAVDTHGDGGAPIPVPDSEIKSDDGRTQIIVPAGWSKAAKLNEKADLQASNLLRGEYLIVLSEAKSDFVDFTLQKHDETTLKALVDKLEGGQASEKTELTINGHKAVQSEVSGTTANTHIVYLHTTVEDATHFHQILAWSLKSQFDKNKDDLQKVTASFKSSE